MFRYISRSRSHRDGSEERAGDGHNVDMSGSKQCGSPARSCAGAISRLCSLAAANEAAGRARRAGASGALKLFDVLVQTASPKSWWCSSGEGRRPVCGVGCESASKRNSCHGLALKPASKLEAFFNVAIPTLLLCTTAIDSSPVFPAPLKRPRPRPDLRMTS
ncbi:hypothetical protein BDV96DRAFT_366257 [Lophiotrema nucula]|uniref:Uncharacterized protein n=1 Tax=Lophiotrema nucula TaxID=690887 RepID=A0A6A5ZHC8_9PLEO|nr:hypothetical protein BDV96DRAFT_366257 [Lophiotrema nucula]